MNRLHKDTTRLLNRSAVVVRPAQPFLDWLHAADPSSSATSLSELTREPSVYLFPEVRSPDELERLLRRVFDTIFTAELDGWFREETTWPGKRTFCMFRAWFECSSHSMLIDLADAELGYD